MPEDVAAVFLSQRLDLKDGQCEADCILFFILDFLPPETLFLQHLLQGSTLD